MSNFYHKLSSLFLLLPWLLLSAGAFGQENDPAVSQLLQERASLIASGQSTTPTDIQLYELGHRPKAVFTIVATESGSMKMICPLYRPFSPENVQGMFGRLSAHYPHLLSLEKGSDGVSLIGLFQSGTTAEQISEVTNHFGYDGYETQY
jgi:hypothetical protein